MNRFTLYILVSFLLLTVSCGGGACADDNGLRTDSLCTELAAARYSDVARLDSVAVALETAADGINELLMVACNARGYAAMMRMDYVAAVSLYEKVLAESRCEIERLVADVGLMTVCYRTSKNRHFFDYRADALSRIERINEEVDYLADSDRERFVRAKIEFSIVSVCYFSNLGMRQEKAEALEALERDAEQADDAALRMYARMIVANNTVDNVERLKMLCVGQAIMAADDIEWLNANYSLLLAISMRDSLRVAQFVRELPDYHAALNVTGLSAEWLSHSLALDAVNGFERYGDRYMTIEALSVAASCNTEYARYDSALCYIDTALGYINEYYSRYYPSHVVLPENSLYVYDNGVYGDSGIVYNIPECMLSVRREASCAFAGIDDIEASNINRNSYLELLAATRLNKELESKVDIAEKSIERLDILLLLLLLLVVAAVVAVAVMFRRRRRHTILYSANLKQLQGVCRGLLPLLPREAGSKEELCGAISALLDDSLGGFSGATRFSVAALLDENSVQGANVYEFPLNYMHSATDTLYVATECPLLPEKKSILAMLVPYVAVAVEEGLRLSNISDESERAAEQRKAYSIYLSEHKRENLLKRVSVSVLMCMRPYIDRIIGELNALSGTMPVDDARRKLSYVAELTDRLDELNVIQERWIKMRKGELNLRVENFALVDIFAIIKKSKPLLERKGLELKVRDSEAIVKADKSLTLFMVNTLVENAVKFTPEGGSVLVEGVEGDTYVEIGVIDTGIGISADDIDKILVEKVYDASEIGRDNALMQSKNKGGGFGLMNCKGIIEKYRKTDALFDVCRMDIKSKPGHGSRFSFRLPKGVLRIALLLLMLLPVSDTFADERLKRVSEYADSLYYSNVDGDYERSMGYAQSAIGLLNDFYRSSIGGNDTLTLGAGAAAELKWWREALFPDSLKEDIYYNILDIRNESAVASLALRRWQQYRYCNYVYTSLYRLVHEDKGLADRYVSTEIALNSRLVAVTLLLLLLLLLILSGVVSYVRHNVIERNNERMVLDANKRLLMVTTGNERIAPETLLRSVVNVIYDSLGEGLRIDKLVLTLNVGDRGAVTASAGSLQQNQGADIFMLGAIESGSQYVSPDGLLRVLPLNVVSADECTVIGALEVVTQRQLVGDEVLSLELVTNYTAAVVNHALVRVENSYIALEELEEQAERMKFEENRLHVQNMVLDNCLSVVKHETIYYPSRIRTLVERSEPGKEGWESALVAMRELMEYYSSIFGILGNCAKRELDDRCFSVSTVELQSLFDEAVAYAARRCRKLMRQVSVVCEPTAAFVSVDRDLVGYLLESLVDASLKLDGEGVLQLRAVDIGDSVRVELLDSRLVLTSDEVSDLFMPTQRNLTADGSLVGMEYLAAKEIVRLHEDNTGRRGSRMEARSDVSGTVIMFTLPK